MFKFTDVTASHVLQRGSALTIEDNETESYLEILAIFSMSPCFAEISSRPAT